MDNELVGFFGEKRRACASSPDNIPGAWKRAPLEAEAARAEVGGSWLEDVPYSIDSLLNPSRPCSQLSFVGQRHHFASRLACALLPLCIRKRRRRRHYHHHHHHHHHHHPQSLMRVNKRFTISCQSDSNPQSCSYKTFLVRHPAARILGERFRYIHSLILIVGGCGTFFAITIASKAFKGIPVVKQHRLVNETLKKEIEGIHGLQVPLPLPLPLLSPLPY